ncbi:hypothetical protein Aph01nite_10960 [Acrocarpospora phusangensis]|uniref:Uncharacterized protein n=2 Tax=Acrocarpospora phusangensis TaxID=1070424 RepID=A0A919UIK6_9ACTN|nr:hypothetical protein Aph01nite_10960 [Acrocarpospora phusangensis]
MVLAALVVAAGVVPPIANDFPKPRPGRICPYPPGQAEKLCGSHWMLPPDPAV